MLTSLTVDRKKLWAALAEKSNAPFYCPECGGETVLHKGRVKIHHFAHKSGALCEYGGGESEAHMRCKSEIYMELAKHTQLECELEKPLGKVRPDVWVLSKATGNQCAIEVQISTLTMDKIIYRTEQYNRLGVYVLWLSPWTDDLDKRIYSPRMWEKWVHATYFGRVYYWRNGLTVTPIHFGDNKTWVEESTWYEPGGYEMSAGGYFRTQKRTKVICPGNDVDIAKAFKPVQREAWAGGDIFVPKSRLLVDTQPVWWKGKEQ